MRDIGAALARLLTGAGALAFVCAAIFAREPPFETVTVSARDIARERVLEGVVEAVKESTVSAQTSGRVAAINVDVDDYVPAGNVILRLHDTEQRARVARAQAELAEAQARYTEARSNYARMERLHADQVVPKATLDAAKANLDSSRSRLEAADAALAEAREQLDYTVVRAPYSGVVTKRHVQIGEAVRPGQPLMSGFSLEELRVRVEAPQRLVNAIRERRAARLLQDTAPSVPAREITIFPYASAGSNTFTVRVDLPARVEGLYPGMLVKVAFEIGSRQRLAVPASAVVYRSEVTGVYVVKEDGAVVLRQIRTGQQSADGTIEVLAGLAEGERIALDPVKAGIYLKESAPGR